MSSGNPYAQNGYAPTNAVNSNLSGRYGELYAQPANASSGSLNGYVSRERPPSRDRARRDGPSPLHYNDENPQAPYSRQRYGPASGDHRAVPHLAVREPDYNDPNRSRERRQVSNGANEYKPYSRGRSAKSMEEVVQHIQSNWKDMTGDECIPVQIALRLMDPSSLGLADKEPDFQETQIDLEKTLKAVVNEQHQDFNSSIGTYHKIQSNIQASQSRVRYLKQALAGAQTGLLTTKPELKGLATSSQDLDDTLQLFGYIETMQGAPEKLEARISEKHFLTAVDHLQEALRLVRKTELNGIGAIADLRTYFANQEQSLTDILIEELHDHLYLKSPYCQDRWKTMNLEGEEKNAQESMTESGVNPWDKQMYHYLSDMDTKTLMVEDASRNPEADTFYYIHMIIESLNRLGHLDDAISRIEQRMPIELFKVVEKTNNDIDAKHPSHLRGQLNKDKRKLMPVQVNDGRGTVLSDFLWTLYAKFEAIAEGHRVLHEVILGIANREKLAKPEKYCGSFKELWKLYQMEMRSLLHDYLATDGNMSMRSALSNTAGGDVFGRSQRDRNKKMFKLSEMDEKSSNMKNEQEELDEILKASVPGLVSKNRGKAGMVNTSERSTHDSTAAGHKLLIEPSVFNMTVLLPPSLAFVQHLRDIVPSTSNIPMSTLTSFLDDFLINIFHPQLEEAVTDLCTQAMMDIEAFADDSQWSKHSPRPIFKGTVAFMSLIRAFSDMLISIPRDQMFTELIIAQLVAYYDRCQAYMKVMVSRLTQSSSSTANIRKLKTAAAYAESGEIHDVASEILKSQLSEDSTLDASLVSKEVQLLVAATKSVPLTAFDIISDPRTVHNLSLLYNSMQWLCSALIQLRHIDDSPPSNKRNSRGHSRNNSQTRRWTLVTTMKSSTSAAPHRIYLPLTPDSALPFDSTVASFRNLAEMALLTLHIDIRCGVIHQLARSLRGSDTINIPAEEQTVSSPIPRETSTASPPPLESGLYPWVLLSPPTSASPLILELNNDLVAFDTNTSAYLGAKERRFITSNLSGLVDRMLVVGADSIGVMNVHGANRMALDVLVLQQNLRNITSTTSKSDSSTTKKGTSAEAADVGLGISTAQRRATVDVSDSPPLTSSAQYYSLFLAGPEKILEHVKRFKDTQQPTTTATSGSPTKETPPSRLTGLGYTYDELRTLIELCFSAALRGGDREESVRARKNMGDCLLQLGELMWDS